ncbi:MAG: hypothetical protein IKN27_09305 [Selenomonadaceae bacterium]|nr:hypothetical protein [Selenomonadaceae bacterium]
MKHSIRIRVFDPISGLMRTKIEQVNGELGSGVYDRNGREIFEGDIVKIRDAEERTTFEDGSFFINDIPIWRLRPCVLEVVGHVEDTK